MKKILVAVIILCLVGPWVRMQKAGQAQAIQPNVSQEEIQKILQATVRIEVKPVAGQENPLSEIALGSVVLFGNEMMIVTHNHWGAWLTDDATVELYASDGTPMAMVKGGQIWSAVRYQDKGTLVFQAPEEFHSNFSGKPGHLQMATPGNRLAPGMVVQVVHFIEQHHWTMGVQSMQVVAGFETSQPPVYCLLSLSGQPVLEGDSGGGVWIDGALTANTWSTILVPAGQANATSMKYTGSEDRFYSDTSFAAILTWPNPTVSGNGKQFHIKSQTKGSRSIKPRN